MSDIEVKVLATTAMKTALEKLSPQFREVAGDGVSASFGPSARIEKRLVEGEAADVAILAAAAAAELTARGTLLDASAVVIARSALGVAVAKGAVKPDISSVEAFRHALLEARTIAVSKPVGAGLSGAHMAKVFNELGIAAAVADKVRYGSGGVTGLVGLILERGEAEIGVQQIAELKAVAGIDFVGPLPAPLQCVTPFAAAIPTSARQPEAGRRLIDFLATPAAKHVIAAKGLEPA